VELPAGDVTLMFTDIEGSTRRWEAEAARMAEAVGRLRGLAHQIVERHSGAVVKDTGDGAFAAFADPCNAAHAAVELQRAVRVGPWPIEGGLRVRIGIHRGGANPVAGDYHGPVPNRAARITDAAWGGQIVVSAVVAEALHRCEGVALRPLGRHRLKDLAAPVELHQVSAEGLDDVFPAVRSLDARPHNLPAAMTALIGRELDVRAAHELLATGRLVTLTGAGGSGKTRLALQVAAEALDRFEGGVWFVDLAPLTAADQIAAATAQAMSLHERPGAGWERAVFDHLAEHEVLIVLDNCEHVIDGAARFAEQLLRRCQSVRVLATSREPLHVAGEVVRAVPPLPVPEAGAGIDEVVHSPAAALFLERATAAKPGFQPTDSDTDAIVGICRRLDGIPLALELAAARVASLPLPTIAERLDERFRLLTGGARTALPRQRTLEATVEWSYDLLGERERVAFAALSVFAGSIELDAAEVVLGGIGFDALDVADALATLVDRSLLSVTDHGYQLLETVRAYAVRRAPEVLDLEALRSAHLLWIRRLAGMSFRQASAGAVQPRVTRLIDDVRSSIQWGREAGHLDDALFAGATLYWYWAGEALNEGVQLLGDLLAEAERTGGASPAALQAACVTLGQLCNFRGDHQRAIALVDRASMLANSGGRTPPWLIDLVRGYALPELGDWDGGKASLQAAFHAAVAGRDQRMAANASLNLAALAFALGDVDEAEHMMAEMREFDRTQLDAGFAHHIDEWEAALCIRRAALEPARQHLLVALDGRQRHPHRVCTAHAVETAAAWLLAAGASTDAAVLSGAAEAVRNEYGAPVIWFESPFSAETSAQLDAILDPAARADARAAGAELIDGVDALERASELVSSTPSTLV
jgi:predicted ATPase/class 3 adenylate cyclase